MIAPNPQTDRRVSKRAFMVGLSMGLLTAAVSISGEQLRRFNCISAWFIQTVVFTLVLAVVCRPRSLAAVGTAVSVAYSGVISYVVIQAIHSGRWRPDDYLPVFVSFFLFVILPTLAAAGLDQVCLRHARQSA